jgi:hypothetical protein
VVAAPAAAVTVLEVMAKAVAAAAARPAVRYLRMLMAITLPTARRADIGVSRRMKVGFSPHPLEP